MATKYLGTTLDLHGGGRDLIFPHHENEIAQSESANGCPFCNHWVENGMVNLAGEKMSKSTGHFFAVSDVRQQVDPETLRLYLLSTHYRSPIDYSEERLREGRAALVTGNGHARTDRGVPLYLARQAPGLRVVALGQIEVRDGATSLADYAENGLLPFDYVWFSERVADRPDPCEGFRKG